MRSICSATTTCSSRSAARSLASISWATGMPVRDEISWNWARIVSVLRGRADPHRTWGRGLAPRAPSPVDAEGPSTSRVRCAMKPVTASGSGISREDVAASSAPPLPTGRASVQYAVMASVALGELRGRRCHASNLLGPDRHHRAPPLPRSGGGARRAAGRSRTGPPAWPRAPSGPTGPPRPARPSPAR